MRPDVLVFRADDGGFHEWLDENPSGCFLNVGEKAAMLHTTSCSHFDRSADVRWTETPKVCGETHFVLARWAAEEGVEVLRCRDCAV